jgi:anti-anti-sigma regulatory factor
VEDHFPTPEGVRYFVSNRFPVLDASGEIQAICGILTDITDFRRAQEENRRLQAEMLRVQAETLRALSTPLIPIAQGVVAMPLIGAISHERSQQILETMLAGVVSLRARIAIFDVTGVPTADSEVASALNQAASAVRLLGAQVVLTGIRPEFAQTLVSLGIDLAGITTLSTLQAGIAYALGR